MATRAPTAPPVRRGERGSVARLVGWARHHPTAAAALLYGVLSLVMFAPGLLPGRTLSASDFLWTSTPWDASRPAGVQALGANGELADAVSQFQPALLTTRRALPDIPLWDPHLLGGRPFVADPQSVVFSPFSIPSYVLPFWFSLGVAAALKLWVAALGAFGLGRVLGMRFGGALLTGLVFGFSLWMVTWVSWPHSGVWALLPWLCWMAELCVRRPGPLPVAGLGAAVGLQFLGGHPSSSIQVLLVVGLFWLVRLLAARPGGRGLALRLGALVGGLVLGTALAAAMLVPFAELLGRSGDVASRSASSDLLHQPARYLLGLFLHDFWGHGRAALDFGSYLPERAYYVAALPLALAGAALVARPRPERVAVALVAVASLAIATGSTPVYDLILALPGLGAANNGRFAVLAVLGLAVLAGWGIDELTEGRLAARRRHVVSALVVVLLIVPVALVARRLELDALGPALRVALGFTRPTEELASSVAGGLTAVVRLASVLEWLVVAGAAALLVLGRLRGRLGASAFVALAVLLVGADLFRAGMGYNPAIPREHAVQPTTPAIRFLNARRPERVSGLKPVALSLAVPLSPNVALRYGPYDARGYVIPTDERTTEIWRTLIAPDPNCFTSFCTTNADSTPKALRALGVLGVGFLLQNRQDPPLPGLRTAYDGPDARIYRNPSRLPRAFLVSRQVVRPEKEAALATLASAGFDPRAAALTEERLPGLPEGASAGPDDPGRTEIRSYGPERVRLDVQARRRALLVLSDSFYPGWKARVDGAEVPIHRVDYLLRGVAVPPGDHRVEFSYEPGSWRAGWIVSLLALAALAILALLGLRRRS